MKSKLPQRWLDKLEILDIAFQPIVNIHTGRTYAVEALLRNYQDVGFQSIFSLFDALHDEEILYDFDIELREKAIRKFTQIQKFHSIKLFYNLDNRLFDHEDLSVGNTSSILKKYGVKKENICFELSERHEIFNGYNLEKLLQHYKSENFSIAIDDFGVGYSGYKLLYDSTPDIIKIDRFFLQNIENNLKKKLMVRSITNLSIQLGIKVIAEGVETKEELYTCKEIGCHLVQGYLIERPEKDPEKIVPHYKHIGKLISEDKRNTKNYTIRNYIEKIEPLYIYTKMNHVIEYFKNNKSAVVLPIVNATKEPVGIIHEADIKDFLYSPYGISLLLNNEDKKSRLKSMLHICGTADINSSINTIVELFSNNSESVGILITKNSRYYGFLSAKSIISIMNQENLLIARDQNPLTKLPGNTLIEQYLSGIAENTSSYLLCYFDLDNFKAFNDVYGFRSGDRVIQHFADLLKKSFQNDVFKAHIGGDDFFVAFDAKKNIDFSDDTAKIKEIIKNFSDSVREFYSDEDKENAYITAKDRNGVLKKFPLLSVSASVLEIRKDTYYRCEENINNILSLQKKVAKECPFNMAISSLL